MKFVWLAAACLFYSAYAVKIQGRNKKSQNKKAGKKNGKNSSNNNDKKHSGITNEADDKVPLCSSENKIVEAVLDLTELDTAMHVLQDVVAETDITKLESRKYSTLLSKKVLINFNFIQKKSNTILFSIFKLLCFF